MISSWICNSYCNARMKFTILPHSDPKVRCKNRPGGHDDVWFVSNSQTKSLCVMFHAWRHRRVDLLTANYIRRKSNADRAKLSWKTSRTSPPWWSVSTNLTAWRPPRMCRQGSFSIWKEPRCRRMTSLSLLIFICFGLPAETWMPASVPLFLTEAGVRLPSWQHRLQFARERGRRWEWRSGCVSTRLSKLAGLVLDRLLTEIGATSRGLWRRTPAPGRSIHWKRGKTWQGGLKNREDRSERERERGGVAVRGMETLR